MVIQINGMLCFVFSIRFKIQTSVIYMINKDLHCQTICTFYIIHAHIYSGVQRSDTTSEDVSLLV